jgi:predicted lipid-binding transport protein (Tim44 family)
MVNRAQTQGRMLSATLSSGESYDQSTSSYQPTHTPEVHYQYEVNGVQYTGTRVTEHSFSYGSSGDVEKFLAQHPAGAPVTVDYNPANPADAVLETGMGSMANKQLLLAGGVLGGIFAAFGGLTAIIIGFTVLLLCAITVAVVTALLGFNSGF